MANYEAAPEGGIRIAGAGDALQTPPAAPEAVPAEEVARESAPAAGEPKAEEQSSDAEEPEDSA